MGRETKLEREFLSGSSMVKNSGNIPYVEKINYFVFRWGYRADRRFYREEKQFQS